MRMSIGLMCLGADRRFCRISVGMRLLLGPVLWRGRWMKPDFQASLAARSADKVKIIPFSFGWCYTMTSAMLPYIALFTRYAVRAIVDVHSMRTADGAIKVPIISSLLLQFLQRSFSLLHFCMTMTLGRSPIAVRGLSVDATLS